MVTMIQPMNATLFAQTTSKKSVEKISLFIGNLKKTSMVQMVIDVKVATFVEVRTLKKCIPARRSPKVNSSPI